MSQIYNGVHAGLEAEADRLIRESLKDVTSHSEKSDILTPWKLNNRRRREVYVKSGTPDPAIRKGMFHREANTAQPDLNSRDGVAPERGRARRMAMLRTQLTESGVAREWDE